MVHQTDTACTWLVRHNLPDCANCTHLSRLPGGPATQFFLGSLLLAGDIESNPGPKPTLKPFYTHALNPPHSPNTLIHQSNPLNPPLPHSPKPNHCLNHPHLSNLIKPPHPLHQPPTLTPYTLDLIQPTRPDSPHLLPSHKHPYAAPNTTHPSSSTPHHHSTTHTRTLSHTKQTILLKQNSKK